VKKVLTDATTDLRETGDRWLADGMGEMGFFTRRHEAKGSDQRSAPSAAPQSIEVTLCDGDETLEVVGESNYQEALWSIVGGPTTEPVRLDVIAMLLPEPTNAYDSNAIAVWVNGLRVGYLGRDNAVRYRPGLLALYQKHGGIPVVLNGEIIGGGQRGDGIGYLGVFLQHDPADFGLAAVPTSNGTHVRTGRHEAGASVFELGDLPQDDAGAIKQLRRLLEQEQDPLVRHFACITVATCLGRHWTSSMWPAKHTTTRWTPSGPPWSLSSAECPCSRPTGRCASGSRRPACGKT
jgi:hypothetical protein